MAIIAMAGQACSTTGSGGTPLPPSDLEAHEHLAPNHNALRLLSQRQQRRPDQRAMSAPPHSEEIAELTGSLPDEESRHKATLSLANTLPIFDKPKEPSPRSVMHESGDDVPPPESLRAYVSGRTARLMGDDRAAEADLISAARLDPDAMPVWRELAEVQLSQGNVPAATGSYRRALERDPNDIRSLEQLSRHANIRRDYEQSIEFLIRLRALPLEEYDPALPAIVSSRIGAALQGLGYLSAAAEAYTEAASIPESISISTNYAQEYSLLLRARGDVWRQVGDLELQTGRPDAANASYTEAARHPSLETYDALLARRVHAAMRAGRSADAALITLSAVESGRPITRETLAIIEHIASNSAAGEALAQSLASCTPALGTNGEAAIDQTEHALLLAAALPAPRAIRHLRDCLTAGRFDWMLADALLLRIAKFDSSAAAIAEAERLIEIHPLFIHSIISSLHHAGITPSDIARRASTAARTDSSLGLRIMEIVAYRDTADPRTALEKADALARDVPGSAAVASLRANILYRLGRPEDARAALIPNADAQNDAVWIISASRTQFDAGDVLAARSMIRPLCDRLADLAPDVRALAATLIGQIEEARYNPEDAERYFLLALDAVPSAHLPYRSLIELYAQRGALADQGKLVAIVRRFQTQAALDPLTDLMRAQDLLLRRQIEQSIELSGPIATWMPDRRDATDLYIAALIESGQFEAARQWLTSQLERFPAQSDYIFSLVRVLNRAERPQDAADLIRAHIESYPGDIDALHQLEALLRTELKRPEEADAVAAMRLARSPSTPETLLNKADLALRLSDFDQIASAILSIVPFGSDLIPNEHATLSRIMVRLAGGVGNQTYSRAEVLALLEEIVPAAPQVETQVHAVRIAFLVDEESPTKNAWSATRLAATSHPERAEHFWQLLIQNQLSHASAIFEARRDAARSLQREALRTAVMAIDELGPDATVWPRAIAIYLAWGMNEHDTLVRMIDRSMESLDDCIDTIGVSFRRVPDFATRAEGYYTLANRLSGTRYDDRVDDLYRRALTSDPRHIWANNNLGYRLVERRESLDEAHEMILVAFEEMTSQGETEAAVIDSLGWVRYVLGIIHDETIPGSDPPIVRSGAISLLRSAYDLTEQETRLSPTPEFRRFREAQLAIVGDHLGDALWAGAQRQQAIERWNHAAALASELLEHLAADASSDERTALEDELQAVLQSASTKAADALEDREPAIAPMAAPPSRIAPIQPPAKMPDQPSS